MKKLFFIVVLFSGGLTISSAQVRKDDSNKRTNQTRQYDQNKDQRNDGTRIHKMI